MTIKNILLTSNNSHTTLSADFAFQGQKFRQMFFRVGNKYKTFIFNDASPFLASLLLPCMKRKENILIEGAVSKKVLNSIPEIMNVVKKWNVGFNKISIKTSSISASASKYIKAPDASGSFFTGGVDSFYTYLKNKKNITYFILIHGCDIPLKNKNFFSEVLSNIKIIAKKEKVGLIIVESNYRELIEPFLEWEWNLGSALGAIGLLLRKGLKNTYIPGGMRADQLCPYGSHPDLDPLWSAEKFIIVHDGCEKSRLEKIRYSISKSSLVLKYLRVCCYYLKGHYNCNQCFKCVQTKIELLCANALHKAESFDKILTPSLIQKIYYNNDLNFDLFGQEALEYLKKHNKHQQIQEALKISLRDSKNPNPLRKFSNFIAFLDKKYNNRKLYTLIYAISPSQDRTHLFKLISYLGLVK